MTVTLRPYQVAADAAIRREFDDLGRRSTLLVMATGAGKTVSFLEQAQRFRSLGGRVLILAHRDELIQQPRRKLEALGIVPDVEKGKQRASMNAKIVIASVQSLRGPRLARFARDHFDLVICDEVHHARARGYVDIFEHFIDAKILGVTATPDRADGLGLGIDDGGTFESVAFRYEIRQAIRDQWLVPITARRVVVDSVDLSGIATRAGDLAQDQLAEIMETERAIRGVVMPLLELAGDLTTIVFGVDVEHARLLDQALNDERPGCSRWISGETEQAERDRLTEGHNAGEYQYLCNCDVLSEGYDSPRVACVAIAAPTKSRARYVQRCGRATRILGATLEESVRNGKARALILDFTGQAGRHRLAGPVDCLAGSDQGMDAFGDDLRAELDALLGTQQIELEAALARADASAIARRAALDLDAVVSFHAEQIDPFLGSPPRAAAPQIAMGWADKAPSDAQVKALDAAGVTITRLPPSFSAADATRLLIRLRARREAGLCSLAQAKRLHAAGIRGTAVIRFERATVLITKLREAGWGRPWVIWGEPEAQTEPSLAAIDAIRARSAAKRSMARLAASGGSALSKSLPPGAELDDPGGYDALDHESLP